MCMVVGSRPGLVITWDWHIGLALLCSCSGALEYPTTNSWWILNTCSTFFVQVQQQNVPHWWDWLQAEPNWHFSNYITQIPATSSEQSSGRCTSGNPHQLPRVLSNSAQYKYHNHEPAAAGAPNQDAWTARWSTGNNSPYSWAVLSHRWVLV